jgi:hypothetical protein
MSRLTPTARARVSPAETGPAVQEPRTAGGAAADDDDDVVVVVDVGVRVVAQPKSTPAPKPQQPAQKTRREGRGLRGRSSEAFTGSVCHVQKRE